MQGSGPGHRRVLGKSLMQRLGRCPWDEQQFAHRFLLAHKGLVQGSGTQFTPAATATLAAALFKAARLDQRRCIIVQRT